MKSKNMSTINLKNVICISLKSHTENQLDAIGATYDIDHEFLCKMKNDGCKKLWIHIGGGYVIAGLDTDNIDDVYFSPQYHPVLTSKIRKAVLSIKPVKVPKMPSFAKVKVEKKQVEKVKVELTVDGVLDKISAFGMDSLTKEELNFLKSFK